MPSAVRAEAIRVTASLAYFLRKYLFDMSLAPHGAAEFVRMPLICLEYLAGFHGYLSMGFQDGLAYLSEREILTGDHLVLLGECADRKTSSRYADVDQDLGIRGCSFLESMMLSMVTRYRQHGVCDVRWNGSACEVSWNLDLPQAAAMTVLRQGHGILLLRRPRDDYLYLGRWTVPGGYLQPGEPPDAAAAREVAEETGLLVAPRPVMPGEPIVSDRLAAFTFEAQVSVDADFGRLAEHDARVISEPDQALAMDLTPEARLVVDRYHRLHDSADGTRTTQQDG
jgi:8-oxo-dGTP pyrophosphatase MutT (NUDIX family)